MNDNDAKKRRFRHGDEQLLLALASGLSIRKAAQKAGLSEKTAERRMNDPAFDRELDAIRRQFMDRALGRLAAATTAAAATLRRLLDANSEMVRLSAARTILELHAKMRQAIELEQRVAALEEQAESRGPAVSNLGRSPYVN